MATKPSTEWTNRLQEDEAPGFDVTCVIGRVTYSDDGADSPYMTALHLIGEHGAPGTYVFSMPDGVTATVAITFGS